MIVDKGAFWQLCCSLMNKLRKPILERVLAFSFRTQESLLCIRLNINLGLLEEILDALLDFGLD